ncbi:MAG: bacterial Ig-like domain-containing protein [Paludibacteraceae bacterium]
MKKITFLLSIMLLACTTSLWAGKITTVDGITSGKKYYIGATTSSSDYYLKVDGSSTSTSTAGTAVTDKTTAAVFTFTQSGDAWTIQFENGNYLSLSSEKANGKVVVSSDASTFTISNTTKNLLRIAINDSYSIQKNSSTTNFGSYGNTQTDVWLEEYVEGVSVSSIAISGNATKTTYKDGEAFDVTGLTVTATKSDASTEDVTNAVEWTISPEVLTVGVTSVSVKATCAGKEASTTVNVTVLSLQELALSGEPKNMTYYLGETFNPDGLVVTGTYSDGTTTADVTDKVSWEIDPETFTTLGTVSVEVMAFIGESLMSNVLTINNVQVVDVDKYAKVTSAEQLADGLHIIIVDKDTTAALSTKQNDNNRSSTTVKATESGLIVPSSSVEIITLNAKEAKWELQVSAGYLYAIYGNNYIRTQTTNSDASLWTITYTEAGAVTISTAVSNSTKSETRYIKKNNSSALFSCYTGGQKDIAIFARQYTVTVVSNDENMGTVTGSGNYFENNVATLVATPKEGYKFTGWSNNAELSAATQDLTVTANITVTANFAKGETAIESAAVETPAIKTIENGQLVIIRDGVKYNAMGVRL